MSRYNIVSTIFLVLFIASLAVDGLWSVPYQWYLILLLIYLVITVAGSFLLSAGYFIPVLSSGSSSQAVAITFDDGPIEGKTEKILEILNQYGVPGAFFCIGHRVQSNPDLVRRMHAEGHLIGNHSYTHAPTFDLKSSAMISRELADTDTVIVKAIGKKPKFFRPPYGVTNPMVATAVRTRNYKTIGWSVRSFDTVIKDRDKLFSRVSRSLKGGDIVLFHDYSDTTIDILPSFLEHIRKVGLKVVRVDELLNEKAYG